MSKNVLILGCGRSGTSMLAGSIASSGQYNIGGVGHPGNKGNRFGYFETKEVNGINDDMLFQDSRSMFTEGSRHGWLTRFPINEHTQTLPDTVNRIKSVISQKPFCLKDPRFSFTLPIWQHCLPNKDVEYICMVRHPGAVVNSMIKNCLTAPYLSKIKIDRKICYDIWRNMYDHILRHANNNWIFLHYHQVLDGDGLDIVELLLDTKVNRNFLVKALCRSRPEQDVPKDIMRTYNGLCERARYSERD